MNESLSVELVIVDGVVDTDESLLAFETALEARVTEREIERTGIANAVSELFALPENKGKSIPMPTVASMVCAALNVPALSHNVITERVLGYLRVNSQGETTDGVQERPASLFVTAKGKHGGVSIRADRPVSAK
jgi:hypothetical protein